MSLPAKGSHPDGRPYPWLSGDAPSSADDERYLIYQPFAGMCNQFSCLECAVALARVTGRTLVLPRWRPQYGWQWLGETADYFDCGALASLVRCITLDEFEAARTCQGTDDGAGVALFRLALEYNPTWSDRGFELYPALRSLLEGLEYFCEVNAGRRLRLGCEAASVAADAAAGAAVVCAEVVQHRISLSRPLRGEREVAAHFAGVTQPVLALDHAFNILALPSLLDAGERELLLSALKPSARLRTKLNEYMARVALRPCLAAHVRRTDHWRLSKLMGDARFWPTIEGLAAQIREQIGRRTIQSWLLATDCTDTGELEVLHAVPRRVDCDDLLGGEDGVAAALLDMWTCVGADFFMGTRGSMYTDYIERFRVSTGKVVDHIFFELDALPAPASSPPLTGPPAVAGVAPVALPVAPPAAPAEAKSTGEPVPGEPSLAEILKQREVRCRAADDQRRATLATAAAGGAARGGALLGLMSERLPPELRAKVLAFHPAAAQMPETICRTPKELFDAFIEKETPRLRAKPMRVAPLGTTRNVALLIEPRPHYALEHVVRNAMLLLNGPGGSSDGADGTDGAEWQLQIFHGTQNLDHIHAAFSAAELANVGLVSLEVDNLSNLAHNELMCTHWLWSRAAAERVLIFQTDSLICRRGINAFQAFDYIGAPWTVEDLWCVGKPWLTQVGGNGGFSLRSRERTLACLDAFSYMRGQCEDVFYVEAMPKVGGKVASRWESLAFSVESVYADDPFGFHAAYKWVTSEQMAALLANVAKAYSKLTAEP